MRQKIREKLCGSLCGGMRIFIKVKTNARQGGVEKLAKNIYIVSVKEKPEKGKANKAAIKAIADYFKISSKNIRIVSGQTSRKKLIEIN